MSQLRMLYEFIWLEITHIVTDVGTIKCVLVDTVLSKMLKIDGGGGQPSYWQCADCDYRSYKKDSYNLKNHIEAILANYGMKAVRGS